MEQSNSFGFREAARMFGVIALGTVIVAFGFALWLAALFVCFSTFGDAGAIPGVAFVVAEILVYQVLESKWDRWQERRKIGRILGTSQEDVMRELDALLAAICPPDPPVAVVLGGHDAPGVHEWVAA